MPFTTTSNGLRYFSFASLAGEAVFQAVFTRRGGVSPAPWDSLNVGGTVGDDPELVAENRLRLFQAAGRALDSLYDVWQVHGKRVVCSDAPRPPDQVHLKADAILTDRPGVTLFMRFADCVPILLYDRRQHVVGLVHAGWQGTLQRVAAAAVATMVARYGSRAEEIQAGIGPSIGPDHYEIGPDVASQVKQVFGAAAGAYLTPVNGSLHLDLWAANRAVLEASGVKAIEVAGICTGCQPSDWYSHRAEHGQTGRFGALISLADS